MKLWICSTCGLVREADRQLVCLPRCHGEGTIVRDGPSEHEYDNQYPCPRCTPDCTSAKGTGWVPVAHGSRP